MVCTQRAPVAISLLLAAFLSANTSLAQPSSENSAASSTLTRKIVSIPIAKREVFFVLAPGFPIQPSSLKREATSYQATFYPSGNNEKNWGDQVRLLVLQGHLKGVENPANTLLVDVLAERAKSHCPDSFFFTPSPARSSVRVSAVWGCKGNREQQKHTVMGYYVVVLGEEDSYVLMREHRTSYLSESPLPSDEVIESWKKDTDTLTICPIGGELCGKLGEVPR